MTTDATEPKKELRSGRKGRPEGYFVCLRFRKRFLKPGGGRGCVVDGGKGRGWVKGRVERASRQSGGGQKKKVSNLYIGGVGFG